jgi:cytochrome c
MRMLLTAAALVAAGVCGPAGAITLEEAKIIAGEALFHKTCRRCHSPDAAHDSYGPPLVGVIGRQAGTYPGYEYSPALRNSGIVWTPAALRAWMEDNKGFMPGTKMRHVGISDPEVQDFILSYIAFISSPAQIELEDAPDDAGDAADAILQDGQ